MSAAYKGNTCPIKMHHFRLVRLCESSRWACDRKQVQTTQTTTWPCIMGCTEIAEKSLAHMGHMQCLPKECL